MDEEPGEEHKLYHSFYKNWWTAEAYSTLCEVVADTSGMVGSLKPRKGAGGIYYRQSYSIALLLGLTELKAQICWDENVSGHCPMLWFG